MLRRYPGGYRMRYAVWNNKGGVGKSFLSFVLSTEFANSDKNRRVILVDMCPQANVSEIVLGGNGNGAKVLEDLITKRKTIGGYFDQRISSPHERTGRETEFLIHAKEHNENMPDNLWIIPGDPSLELQSQVINQISAQSLPEDAWKNVHNWLLDLLGACTSKLGGDVLVLIDCNPSFSSYTEISIAAAERILVPCSSDGSSARAIDNIGSLLYGIGGMAKIKTGFFSRMTQDFKMPLPMIHSVLLNRSTQYNAKASKAFSAMFEEIKKRTDKIQKSSPQYFTNKEILFSEIPDNHSVAIVCSHLGKPLYAITPGKYAVHDTNPQVNSEPLDRYKEAVSKFIGSLLN